MSSNSMDLGLLKKSICDLRDSIKMSNLLKMIELGIISKEDAVASPFYKNNAIEYGLSDKTKKKSL